MFKILFALLTLLANDAVALKFRGGSQPVEEKCINRPREFSIGDRNYFYSGNNAATKTKEVSWVEARNLCREYCMDSISVVTQEEFDLVKKTLGDFKIGYIWTSGRVCDTPVCTKSERFQPRNINGWIWADKNLRMSATDKNPPGWIENPWSQTGYLSISQPDNAEFGVNGKNVSLNDDRKGSLTDS